MTDERIPDPSPDAQGKLRGDGRVASPPHVPPYAKAERQGTRGVFRRYGALLLVLVLGLAAGLLLKEPFLHLVGRHDHGPAGAADAA